MHIEYLQTMAPGSQRSSSRGEPLSSSQLEQHLLGVEGTVHNPRATSILCAASTWAYADLQTFASMMSIRGLYGEFVGLNVKNKEAFADTTAYLFLSKTKKVAILAFRGTGLTNIANWLTDVSVAQETQEEGQIHGGFLNAAITVLPMLKALLLSWSTSSASLAETLASLRDCSSYPTGAFPTLEQLFPESEATRMEMLAERVAVKVLEQLRASNMITAPQGDSPASKATISGLEDEMRSSLDPASAEKRSGALQVEVSPALFICGHSLGGAFAAMAGAMLYWDPTLSKIKKTLRSIYTFGAPMFADKAFADAAENLGLGERVFRHRYGKDIIPLLPGRGLGEFKHFGSGYESSKQGVWTRSNCIDKQVPRTVFSVLIGVLHFVTTQVNGLDRLPLPFSMADHRPVGYLRISQAPLAGWTLLGPDYV